MEFFQNILQVPFGFTVDFILPFFVVLSVLVFVHEWGHFIVARMCGVRVDVFSIGFGRELFGFTDKKGTRWKFSLLPLGGYVKMFGDEDPSSTSVDEAKRQKMTEADKKVAFYNKSVAARAAIVFAGPAINFLFAILLFAGLFAVAGQPHIPNIVGGIVEEGAAAQAGVLPDDRIVQINGKTITSFKDIQQAVALNLDTPMDVVVERGDQLLDLVVTPERVVGEDRFGFKHSKGRIGVVAVEGIELQEFTVTEALVAAVVETADVTWGTLEAIGQIIVGVRGTEELGGVIRIGAMAGEFAQMGIISLISFAALLSINLGLLNLFPVPMLDGGHLVFYGIEAIKGSPVSERAQEYSYRFGFACLISLMVFATWNDLVQLNVFEYLKSMI